MSRWRVQATTNDTLKGGRDKVQPARLPLGTPGQVSRIDLSLHKVCLHSPCTRSTLKVYRSDFSFVEAHAQPPPASSGPH